MIYPLAHSESDKTADLHWLQRIREAVQSTDYGSVTIKIHDGRVVEIESARKWRLQSSSPTNHIHTLPTTRVEASHKNPQTDPSSPLRRSEGNNRTTNP